MGGCWRSGCVFPSSAYHIVLPDTLCELCCIRQSKFFVEFLHYEYYDAYLFLSFTTMMGSTRTYCLLPSSTDVSPSPVHRASANLSSSCCTCGELEDIYIKYCEVILRYGGLVI